MYSHVSYTCACPVWVCVTQRGNANLEGLAGSKTIKKQSTIIKNNQKQSKTIKNNQTHNQKQSTQSKPINDYRRTINTQSTQPHTQHRPNAVKQRSHTINLGSAPQPWFALTCSLARVLARPRAHSSARSLERSLDRAHTRSSARSLECSFTRSLTRTGLLTLCEFTNIAMHIAL